jgi:hypothetical protein
VAVAVFARVIERLKEDEAKGGETSEEPLLSCTDLGKRIGVPQQNL